MKHFKKLTVIFSLFVLVACTPTPQTNSSSPQSQEKSASEQTFTLSILENNEPIQNSPFKLSFKDGENLLDVMKKHLTIEEKDGFISSINQHKQDPTQNKYWLFTINGTPSEKAAKDVILKQDDTIEWHLNVLK